jgi:hypothetical protein
MDTKLECGVRVRVKPLPDIHNFLHGAVGMIVKPPSEHALRERRLVRFDQPVVNPYGGVVAQSWLDESMVEVVNE